MMSKYIRLIFFLLLGWLVLCPVCSYARTCDTAELEKGQKDLGEKAKESLKVFHKTVGVFNLAAQDYISSCGEPAQNTNGAFSPDKQVAGMARRLGYSYGDASNWEYTAYKWDSETPVNKPGGANCVELLKKVKSAEVAFRNANNEAYKLLYSAVNVNSMGCSCSDDGSEVSCQVANNSAEELNNSTGKCKTFSEYQNQLGANCPLCGIFRVILQTIAGVSTVAWDAVSKPLTNVVKIFFLVLLALEVLKAVSAVAGSKLSALAKGVMLLCLKCGITVLLLSSPKYIYGYFLSPVIESGLNMGVAIANASGGPGAHCAVSTEDKISIDSGTFDPSLYESVISTVRCFGVSAATLPAIGRGLMCNAWDAGILGLPDLGMWLSGIIMYAFGLMIWLAISFYMIDCTVQIGMLSGLVPLLVACWPFKLTEAYSYKGCKMLMNSFFSYAMLGIILLLGTMITTHAATADGSNIQDIMTAIDENDIKALKKMCSLSAFQILILASCCIFAMKLIGQSNDLADQFSKGSGSSIGNKLGGLAMSAATNAAKGAAHVGGRIAGSAAKHGADAVGLTAAVNKSKDKIKGGWQKGWAKAGKGVGLGKYQNQQTGSGKEGEDGKEGENPENNKNQQGGENSNSQAENNQQNEQNNSEGAENNQGNSANNQENESNNQQQ